ncbi:MAG: hypothetical protein ACREYA_11690 [Cupriavidus necator]
MSKGKAAFVLCVSVLSVGAKAQTIEEITTLQRKKLVSELTKDISTLAPAPTLAAAAPIKREPARPIVVGISGDPSDDKRRSVAVVEADRGPIDYRIGDTTAEGWRVTAIGHRSATFSQAHAGKANGGTLTVEYAGANGTRATPPLTAVTPPRAAANPAPAPVRN